MKSNFNAAGSSVFTMLSGSTAEVWVNVIELSCTYNAVGTLLHFQNSLISMCCRTREQIWPSPVWAQLKSHAQGYTAFRVCSIHPSIPSSTYLRWPAWREQLQGESLDIFLPSRTFQILLGIPKHPQARRKNQSHSAAPQVFPQTSMQH